MTTTTEKNDTISNACPDNVALLILIKSNRLLRDERQVRKIITFKRRVASARIHV